MRLWVVLTSRYEHRYVEAAMFVCDDGGEVAFYDEREVLLVCLPAGYGVFLASMVPSA